MDENNGWIDFSRVNVFLGDQGTGKSCIAKIYTQCLWIEKNIHREVFDDDAKIQQVFTDNIETYFNLKGYLKSNTIIEFEGKYVDLRYTNFVLTINRKALDTNGSTKIMYMPAERNLLAALTNTRKMERLPYALRDFRDEYLNALESKNLILINKLPIGDFTVSYNKDDDVVILHNSVHKYEVDLTSASSGIQSFLPLYLVSKNIVTMLNDKEIDSQDMLNPEAFRAMRQNLFNRLSESKNLGALRNKEESLDIFIKVVAKFDNQNITYIVEEPEQNLFPESQKKVLFELIDIINSDIQSYKNNNQLVITTHSPYLLGFLTLSVKAKQVIKKQGIKDDHRKALWRIVPKNSMLNEEDVNIYYINNGTIYQVDNYEGLPSDDNVLNTSLRSISKDFSSILDLEDEIEDEVK